ncbi:hypothetical protein I4U23_026084 [Adineta vaga]|nr:hypothetical protein I4U23_026084 [Adineta vaga]
MNHCYLLQLFLISTLFISLSLTRTIPSKKLESDEYEKQLDSESEISDINYSSDRQSDEEPEVYQRSILSTSRASATRQQIIDILRQAYSQGWKPNLKHYIPGTRFGRHR